MPMRVLAVADVYEALSSDRPYRAAYSPREALRIMREDVPRRLDPTAFTALETMLHEQPATEFGELTRVRPSLRPIK
jgi:HD-GYP domain-containing protein (c-di-GMP phosphodiesterase class II)